MKNVSFLFQEWLIFVLYKVSLPWLPGKPPVNKSLVNSTIITDDSLSYLNKMPIGWKKIGYFEMVQKLNERAAKHWVYKLQSMFNALWPRAWHSIHRAIHLTLKSHSNLEIFQTVYKP